MATKIILKTKIFRLNIHKNSFYRNGYESSELLDMERKYGGRSFAYIGKCLHCSDNECTRNCGTPCRHPEKVRPSLEAFGFDIAKTLSELFNIELLWGKDGKLPEYLVLVSGFFHNEYELCNIAY